MKVAMEVDKPKTKTKKLSRSRRRRKQNKRKTNPDKERENKPDSPWDSVPSTHETPSKATKFENGCDSLTLIKDAVVVLTKLPEYKIGALRPPTPPQFYSEDESFSSSDSDTQWESEEDSSDSDFWVINSKLKYSNSSNCDLIRMPTTSHNCNGISLCSRDKIRPDLPEEEINVDMMVIARRRPMRWQRGKIVEIITKDDGRLKYKVSFEDKGTCLVSGHHIAFDSRPKVEQLYIGARVVVRCQNNKYRFRPGILAELPSRKNQFRFLMFMDDHTPVYVGLPLFHMVCRPLEDVLDDVPDGAHKCFMRQYLKDWPYPHLNKYRAGQSFNVELNGVMQMCEVVVIDCSLMQVVFQENQRREWIFRGSVRLEHIARLWEERNKLESKDDSDSD
ncbi:PREDICTED: histone-lysine N-methyltransferase SETDB1-B-like isoform X1 [Poecilia mexicana]|uniref:histone-lysine N-methyltransferase SETDB1-B-like isoform X1 n=2 Tax=Poecilia reticulata TaxID=8081 RepID=UPI0004A43E20|nr:PREDICTED: histone-lysine N-methyltransferase SETDB1-B-like isoform X1 [Poecilia reticulata]XP_014854454.1 PREDICTED: histone-lysine N-methyltransferase SETDB1-B-like isoform X1 [Poecilia mexicana]XP_014854455.1 PREDICTED: histone-lysine N-methyltransferase SETDB1-B-like isoform X1 [Poecilia mexicana]XP_017162987.1 PREDICTED: histone-lysine N-methyltransferase SETDB1-B-like isoform X1 [Poecilia reticulata]